MFKGFKISCSHGKRLSSELLLPIILIITVVSGCHIQKNTIDEVKLECGIDISQVQDGSSIVKITDATGQDLDSSDISGLAIGSDGQELGLKISSRSCVVVSPSVKELKLKSTKDGQIFGAFLDSKSISHNKISRLSLDKIPKLVVDFSCSDDGEYGRDSVTVPISSVVDGKSENIGIKILAKASESGVVYSVYEKKFGLALGSLGHDIDVSHLPVGNYELQIASNDFSVGLSEPFKIIDTNNRCIFHKVDAMPAFVGHDGRIAIKRGDAILSNDDDMKVRFCKERLIHSSDRNQCVPTRECADPDNYTESETVVANEPGVFRYFYTKLDRANQKSNMACGDYVVSESPAEVSIQWKNPNYSAPGASLDRPLAILPLKISTQHVSLNQEELIKNLKCSAVFVIKNEVEIPAEMVTCASKECSGQSLGKPVPCGLDLNLDMKKAYDVAELWDSVFKVKVSVDDGVGHTSENEAGLWFNSSKWVIRDEGRLLNIDISDSNNRSSNRIFKVGENVQFISSLSKLPNQENPGLAVEFNGNKTSIYKSPLAGYRRSSINGRNSINQAYVSWSSEVCKLYKYLDESSFEEIEDPAFCGEDLVIFDEAFGYLFGSYGNGYGRSNSLFRMRNNSWEELASMPVEFDYCNSPLKFLAKGPDEFTIECAESDISISYANGVQLVRGDLAKMRPFEIPENIATIPTDTDIHCDDDGASFGKEMFYFPVRQLFRKVINTASGDFWVPELCARLASTGDSLVFYDGVIIWKILFEKEVRLEQAHLPSDYYHYLRADIRLGNHLHPLVVTKNQKIKVLVNYEWAEIELPESTPRFEDGTQLQIDKENRLFFVSKGLIYQTNRASDWFEAMGSTKTLKPIWKVSRGVLAAEETSNNSIPTLGKWTTSNGMDLIFLPPSQ